jgi:hypothetical protein
VTGLQAVSENTATPEQLAELSKSGVVDIVEGEPVINEKGEAVLTQAGAPLPELTPEERRSEIAELNDEGAVDEDEYEEDSDEDEELEPNAVDTKLEQLQAKHKAKIEADKEEQRKLLESRTPEQQQAIVDSFTPGQIITNGVTTGAFVEKTEDGGIVVAQKGKKQKMSPATVQNVTTATATDPEPTRNDALVTVLGSADAPNLEAAGLTPTGEAEDGGKILEEKRRDALFPKPKDAFTVFTKLFKKQDGSLVSRSYHEYDPTRTTKQTEATKRINKRNMLRALDQGVEVRIPNEVEPPAGVSVVPVEGKNYSLVDSVEYDEDGVNIGVFKAADLAARPGSFADAYNSNPELQMIKLDRSNRIINVRKENKTDAFSSATESAEGMTAAGQSVMEKIATKWVQSVDSFLRSDKMSGVGQQGVEYFRDAATNKLINAVSKAFEGEKGDPAIVAKVTELFVSGEKPSKIPKLVLEGRPQNKEETALVNRTVKKLESIQAFVMPKKHLGPLDQVKSDTFKYDKLRKITVSLDAPNGDGGTTLGDKLEEDDRAVAADAKFTEDVSPYTAQQEEDTGSSEASAMEQGVSAEQKETDKEQKKQNAELARSLGEEFNLSLENFEDSLSPLEKIAYDYVTTADTPAWRTRKQKLYGQLEDQLEDPNELIADLKEKIAGLARRASGRTYSPAVPAKRNSPIGPATTPTGTTLGRKPSSPKLQRIKRRFLQAKVGLSDEQMVGMSNAEVDRAYLAYNSRADENKAAAAQDAVVSVAPGIERLVELGDQELVGAYADAILAAEKEGDYGKLRDLNFNELVRFGAFESTRELLTRLADPKNKAPRDMQVRAKAFLEMEKRGLKLDNIEVQAANFLKTGTKDRAVWGGLLGRNADYSAFGVYINLDQAHDRETPLQTVLHELAHVATFAKVHGKVKTTAQEDRIIKDLERMRRAAILKAGNASPAMKAAADKAGATTPEARLANYEKALKAMVASGEEGSRRYNGLQNLDEFIVEMTGSPDFVQLLSQLGFGAVNADKRTFNGMIRDAFNAILKLIGVNISPSSELGKAFMDSWNFTFRGTKYKAAPSELLKAVRGVAEAKAEPKTAAKAAKSQSDKSSIPAPQGEVPTTQVNAETKAPESNNQATKQPNPENAEVPQDGGAGEGSGAKVETKPKREKAGRPKKREMRDSTALPVSKEQFEMEMEKGEMSPEERAAEFDTKNDPAPAAPQSPAAKPRVVKSPAFQVGEREMAELRADNYSDILFYAGINEEDYYNAIGSGVLTAEEIERGYVRDVAKMLGSIADDDTVPAPLRHVAQMMLDQGHDFSKVKFRVAREEIMPDGTPVDWAGIYTPGRSASEGEIAVNTNSRQRGGVAQTIVHEALHHVAYYKTLPGYRLNKVEAAALRDMKKLLKHAEKVAIAKNMLPGESVSQARIRLASNDRTLYGLTNIDEFITEILSDEGFQRFLNEIKPMQGIQKKGGLIRTLLDQIFSYLKDFIYGFDVSGDSLLTQGLDNVMALVQNPQNDLDVRAIASVAQGDFASRASVSAPLKGVEGKYLSSVLNKAVPEPPQSAFLKPEEFDKAKNDLLAILQTPELSSVKARGGRSVNLNSPDFTTARFLGWGGDRALEARAVHALTEDFDRKTPNANKVASAPMVPQTLKQADFVARLQADYGNKTYLVFAKLYKDAESPTGVRWHFVEAREDTGAFETQYSNTDPQRGRALQAKVIGIGDSTPKKKTPTEAGYSQGTAGYAPSQRQEIEPDVSSGQSGSLDNTDLQSVQQKLLDEVENLTAKRDRLIEDGDYEGAGAVDGQIKELEAQFDGLPPMSPAGEAMKMIAKLTGAETKSTFNGGTYTAGGALSPDGKLDKQAGDKWRASRQQITAAARVIDTLSTRLVSAVKAAKKSGVEVSTETMNTALGNLDNPLTQAQRSEVRRMREIDEEEANTLEAAHLAKNREAFKVKQRAALAALPANIADAVSEMNEHIAYYSAMLKDSGILDPSMAATVEANLGIYLHRSYEIFDNEKWAKQVRENTKVMQAAERLIKRNIEQRNAAELIRQTESEGGFISKADAQAQTKGTAKQEQIDKAIDDLLAIGEDGMGSVILRGRIPGQKDLSIFDTRGNISPEIQALWGRYEDPTINYAKSVMKMSSLVANHQFLSDLRGLGLKEGWLYNGPEADRPRGYLKISSDNNKSLAPLAGLHGDKLLVEALYQMFPQNGLSDNYAWVRALSKVTGWSMAAKTVLSPVAQVRNNLGNMLFDVAAGNFGFSDIPKFKGRATTAFNMSFRSAFNRYPNDNAFRKAMMSEMQELVRRGVIGESVVGNILGQLMEAKRFSKTQDQFSNHLIDKLRNPAQNILGGAWDTAQKAYSSSDDFWKVMGYMAEVDKYTKAMPGWSPEQVKDHAAKIVRDIRPTYSLSPAVLDKVKAFPFVAPFITFTTEIIRTSINLMKLARYEITEGNRTGNKELKAIGMKRARGIALAAFGPSMIAGGFMALAGIGKDDEERLRRFLPDWQKNSQLLLLGNKDGKVSYLDVSYLDPYDYWKKAFGAFTRSLTASDDAEAMERISRGAMEAAGELLRPFKSEQLVSGAIVDVLRNQDATGRPIYNPQDTGANIAAKTTERLWKAFSPGALDVGGRVFNAATGAVSDSGKAYTLANELGGAVFGQRITEVNVEQALGFKASKFSRDIRDASSLFTREFNSKGTRSPEQIADAYERANEATYSLTADFRDDVLAAIGLGKISPKKAEEILKANRIGKEDIAMIRSGRYKKYEPSDAAKKIAPKDRIKAAEAAVKRAKDTPL